ncbi:hypothetical protein BCR33DRAFT_794900 [Rhizoclosmatium globosum]|uniref:Bulb-type lectin domain-containing protein n=1 Tax=Rhizoclosmatium globosum TaxID=329046 RepID=A0A1Y2AU84_9FUNG|nr:hypothetical protein BCR33DRAFT_794900 [Rhizoclosmatium globosum]|eukprot:ORY26014.1 hypothetical protein BCR33DRAFT_794900 [Rhizoclosmatium globosum]
MKFLVFLFAAFAALVSADGGYPCNNLADWNAKSVFDQYQDLPYMMATGDSTGFKTCLLATNAITTYAIWYATTCNWGGGCISSIWSSGTYATNARAIWNNNGRFYITTSVYTNGPSVWDAGKTGSIFGTQLCLQNDGNLVLYDTGGTVVWAAGSH